MASTSQTSSPVKENAKKDGVPIQRLPSNVEGKPDLRLQKSFAADLPTQDSNHGFYEGMMTCLGDCFGFLGAIPFIGCCPNPFRQVGQGNVGLVTKFGKCYKVVDPGLYQINLLTEKIIQVDVRINVEDIPRQYVMTKDNVNISIDSVLYWHIVDPYCATFIVSNVRQALVERTQTTLRHIVGQRTLQDCIENREEIAQEIQRIVEIPSMEWGAYVESILIKDLKFSEELLETLASAAKSMRVGESKVIAAKAEVEAAKLMREAADILDSRPAMQIRYLETLQQMAKTSGSKVIFMPVDNVKDMKEDAAGAGPAVASGDGMHDKEMQKVINSEVLQRM